MSEYEEFKAILNEGEDPEYSSFKEYLPKSPGDISQGLKRGLYQTGGNLARFGEGASTALGFDAGKQFFAKQAEDAAETAQSYAPKVSGIGEVDSVGSLADYVQGIGAEQVANMGISTAGALAGASAGAKLPGALKPVGALGGGVLGAFAPSFFLNTGEVYGEQRENNVDDFGGAAKTGLGMAALDAVVPGNIASNILSEPVKGAFKHGIKQGVKETAKAAGKGFVKGSIPEGLTETGQEELAIRHRAGYDPNYDVYGDEANERRIEALAAGAIVGGGANATVDAAKTALPQGPLTKAVNKVDSAQQAPAEEMPLGWETPAATDTKYSDIRRDTWAEPSYRKIPSEQELTNDAQNVTEDFPGEIPYTAPENGEISPLDSREVGKLPDEFEQTRQELINNLSGIQVTDEKQRKILDSYLKRASKADTEKKLNALINNVNNRLPKIIPEALNVRPSEDASPIDQTGRAQPDSAIRERSDEAGIDPSGIGTDGAENEGAVPRGADIVKDQGRFEPREGNVGGIKREGAEGIDRISEDSGENTDQQRTISESNTVKPGFIPTHKTLEGDLVRPTEEQGIYVDKDGMEFENVEVEPLEQVNEADTKTEAGKSPAVNSTIDRQNIANDERPDNTLLGRQRKPEGTPNQGEANGLQEKQTTAEEVAKAKEDKHPWQMTANEAGERYYKESILPNLNEDLKKAKKDKVKPFGYESLKSYVDDIKSQISDIESGTDFVQGASLVNHYGEVRKALEEGKQVPQEVLKDYPDLQEQYGRNNRQSTIEQPAMAIQPEQESTLGQDNKPNLELNEQASTAETKAQKAETTPQILTTPKNKYVNQQLKEQQIKRSSPGYADAKARIENDYETSLDRALAQLPFDEFKAHPVNAGASESAAKQAHDALREQYKVSDEATNQVTGQVPDGTAPAQPGYSTEILRQQADDNNDKQALAAGTKNLPGLTEAQSAAVRALPKATVGKVRTEANKAATSDQERITPQQAKAVIKAINNEKTPEGNKTPDISESKTKAPNSVSTKPKTKSTEQGLTSEKTNGRVDKKTDGVVAKDSEKRSKVSGEEEVKVLRIDEEYNHPFERGLEMGAMAHALNENRRTPQGYAFDAGFTKVKDRKAFIDGFNLASTGEYIDDWRNSRNLVKAAQQKGHVELKQNDEVRTNKYEQTTPAVHIEGSSTKTVTPKEINNAIRKSEDRKDWGKTQIRGWLINEIDKAIEKAHDFDVDKARIDKAEGIVKSKYPRLSKNNKDFRDKVKNLFDTIDMTGYINDFGQVTFDVPGDGKFKVLNTKQQLEKFKAKVISTPGFKETRDVKGNRNLSKKQADSIAIAKKYVAEAKNAKSNDERDEALQLVVDIARNESLNKDQIDNLFEKADSISRGRFEELLGEEKVNNAKIYKASKGTETTGSTVAKIKALLPKRVNRLLNNGTLEVVQSVNKITDDTYSFITEDGIEAFYDPAKDKLFLIADNLNEGNLNSVLFHELYHRSRVTDTKFQQQLSALDKRLENRFNLAAKGRGSKLEQEAYKRVKRAGTPQEDQIEEFQAYLITQYNANPESFTGAIKKWMQDLYAAIRAVLIRNGIMPKDITPADLNALAKYGVRFDKSVDKDGLTILKSAQSQSNKGGDVTDEDLENKNLYHGSAFIFDKFDLSNFGAGEGGEGFGYGLHFSDNEDVANEYAYKNEEIKIDGETIYPNDSIYYPAKLILDNGYEAALRETEDANKKYNTLGKRINDIKSLKNSKIEDVSNPGKIYTVKANIKNNELILWDEPIYKQSDKVKVGLKYYIDELGNEATGEELYYYLSENYFDGDKDVSEFLLSEGIKGIKYKNTLQTVDGAYNYTIFNVDDIDIINNDSGNLLASVKYSKEQGDSNRIKGKNNSWRNQKGFEGLTDSQFETLGKIGKPPSSAFVDKAKDEFEKHKYLWRNKLKQGVFDQYDSFKSILNDKRSWMMANISNTGGAVMEAAIEFGQPFLDKSGAVDINTESKSLGQILEPLGEEVDRFLMWVAGNRAEGLKLDGRENLFSDRDIQNLKNMSKGQINGKSREALYNQVRKDFERIHNSIVQIGVDTGLVSKEDAKTWKEQGFYVPFYRLAEDMDASKGPVSVGGLVKQQAYKKLKGADMQLNDLLSNTLMNWNHLVNASLKNQAAKRALESAVKMELANEIPAKMKGKNSVFVRDNGRERWFDVSESQEGQLVLDSLTALNWNGLNNFAMKVMRKFKRALTIGVTASPEFKIANLLRDSIQAIAVSDMSTNIAKNLRDGVRYSAKGQATKARMIAGGGAFGDSGYIHGADPDAIKLVLKKGLDRASILDSRNKLKVIWDLYQDFGARLENINRMANFEQALEQGKDLLTANFEARDQLDFQRTGSFVAVRAMSQIIPFLNARLQGLNKLGRSFADENQRKQLLAVIGTYAAFSVLMYLYMKDDDDYKKAEQWERDTYHLFKVPGSDTMFRFPRPFEVGAIANMIERGVEQFADDKVHGELFIERLRHALTQTLSIDIVPQAVKPINEVWANKSSFTGRSIESQGLRNLSVTERKHAWTSQTAIGLSNAMDSILWDEVVLSPVQVEHLVNGYLGWAGATMLGGIDLIARPAVGAPSKPEMNISDYPIIGRFVRDKNSRNSRFITEFYDKQKDLSEIFSDIRRYRDNKEFEKASNKLDEYRDDLRYRKLFNATNRRLSEMNKRIRLINNNKSMSAEVKRRRIDAINRKRIELAKRAVDKLP